MTIGISIGIGNQSGGGSEPKTFVGPVQIASVGYYAVGSRKTLMQIASVGYYAIGSRKNNIQIASVGYYAVGRKIS